MSPFFVCGGYIISFSLASMVMSAFEVRSACMACFFGLQ